MVAELDELGPPSRQTDSAVLAWDIRRRQAAAAKARSTGAGPIYLKGVKPSASVGPSGISFAKFAALGFALFISAVGLIFLCDLMSADGAATVGAQEFQQLAGVLQQILAEQQAQRTRLDELGQAVQGAGNAVQTTQQTTQAVIQQVVQEVQAGFVAEQQQHLEQLNQVAQAVQTLQGQVPDPTVAANQLNQLGQAMQDLQAQVQQQQQQQVNPTHIQQIGQTVQALQTQVQQMNQPAAAPVQSSASGPTPTPQTSDPGQAAQGNGLFQTGATVQPCGTQFFNIGGSPAQPGGPGAGVSPAVAYAIQQGGVDSRALGKPAMFDPTSTKTSFQDWSDSIITLCDSTMPGIYECMEWVVNAQPKHPLDLTFLKAKFSHLDPLLLAYAESNIFAILSTYTAGEAKSLTRQAKRPNGMEAFRLLQCRFNPVTIGKAAGPFDPHHKSFGKCWTG